MSIFKKTFFVLAVTSISLSTSFGSAFAGDSASKRYRIKPQKNHEAAVKNIELQFKNKRAPGYYDMLRSRSGHDVDTKASESWLRNIKKGDKYYREGKYDKAVQSYSRILENDENDAYANYRVGMAELGLNRHEVARLYLQVALENSPDLYPAYTGLGASYIMDGQDDKASEVLADLNKWAEKCGVLCSENAELQKSRSDINGMIAWARVN